MQKTQAELSMDEIEKGLDEVGVGVAHLFDAFTMQPVDGPLNYWSIYALKADLLKARQSYDVVKRQYPTT